MNLLSYYGDYIASYKGKGVLTLKDGGIFKCKFETGQLRNGIVLLLCDFLAPFPNLLCISSVERFEGITSEGFQVLADNKITSVNYLPDIPNDRSEGTWAAFYVRELSVQMAKDTKVKSIHFGITNFMFTGTEPSRLDNFSCLILPLNLKCTSDAMKLCIIPVRGYNCIMKRVQTLKSIDVTCEVVCYNTGNGIAEDLREVVDNLCYLLSVTRGTKIQWIYCDLYSSTGKLISRRHFSNVTKPYSPSAIIDPRADGRYDTKAFLESTYDTFVEKIKPYKLKQGTIDAYLDAKAENDFLQMRGVKLAVAIEMLKAVFLELPNHIANEYIFTEEYFNKNLFKPLKKALSNVFKSKNIESSSRKAMYKKIKELNRISFGDLLRIILDDIHLKVDEKDINLFKKCRDKLVHTGGFYYDRAKPEERKNTKPLPSRLHGYFFLVNFLDKVYLKLLGYNGPYIDWRTTKPRRANLSNQCLDE
ncbi:MAG: hypothetical protein H8D22_04995 [Candidatus Cloacimonetes bacterium]|nr:hypothetical protein [Candidatus Cloacimonadota bacterium]